MNVCSRLDGGNEIEVNNVFDNSSTTLTLPTGVTFSDVSSGSFTFQLLLESLEVEAKAYYGCNYCY